MSKYNKRERTKKEERKSLVQSNLGQKRMKINKMTMMRIIIQEIDHWFLNKQYYISMETGQLLLVGSKEVGGGQLDEKQKRTKERKRKMIIIIIIIR